MIELSAVCEVKKRKEAMRLITEYVENRVNDLIATGTSLGNFTPPHGKKFSNIEASIAREVRTFFSYGCKVLTENDEHEELLEIIVGSAIRRAYENSNPVVEDKEESSEGAS